MFGCSFLKHSPEKACPTSPLQHWTTILFRVVLQAYMPAASCRGNVRKWMSHTRRCVMLLCSKLVCFLSDWWSDRTPLHDAACQGRLLNLRTLLSQVRTHAHTNAPGQTAEHLTAHTRTRHWLTQLNLWGSLCPFSPPILLSLLSPLSRGTVWTRWPWTESLPSTKHVWVDTTLASSSSWRVGPT